MSKPGFWWLMLVGAIVGLIWLWAGGKEALTMALVAIALTAGGYLFFRLLMLDD